MSPTQSRKSPRDTAAALIKRQRVRRAPIRVDRIARDLGIEVHYHPAEDDLSGALIRENGRAIIGVNSSHHPNRQRFTIAHEIGHFSLHASLNFHVDNDFVRVDFRHKHPPSDSPVEEMEANQFAAELLMPEELLRSDVPKRRALDDAAITSLARRYEVSKQAMEIRLRNLMFLPPVEST